MFALEESLAAGFHWTKVAENLFLERNQETMKETT